MAGRLSSGQLYENFAFYMREKVETKPGVKVGCWKKQFSARAALTYRGGNEAVIAARLTGKQPAFLVIRSSKQALAVTTEWCCADVRRSSYDPKTDQFKGNAYNIRAVVQDTLDRGRVLLTLEAGVSPG